MTNAVESSQEGSSRRLPHVLKHQPVRNTCATRQKKYAAIIDDKRRLTLKMEILSHLEYRSRTRKNAKENNGLVRVEFCKLTENYWCEKTGKHKQTIRKALDELEKEGLIERTEAFDALGAPKYSRLKHGFPDRSRRVALNTEVIDQRMLERVPDLRPTSLDSLNLTRGGNAPFVNTTPHDLPPGCITGGPDK